jgi:hypothetical protein
MDSSTRETVRAVLAGFGVASPQCAPEIDPTEIVILVSAHDFARIDHDEVVLAVMSVVPDTKVWVIETSKVWNPEPL